MNGRKNPFMLFLPYLPFFSYFHDNKASTRMALNIIWISFFLIAFIVAFIKLVFFGDTEIFKTVIDGVFDSAKTGVDISIGLIGILSLFLGFMSVGERAGAINFLSRIVGPFFSKLFPDLPKNHPAMGHM